MVICVLKGDDVKNMKKDVRERFTLRLPKELFLYVQDEADRTGVSINALILNVLWEWLEKKEVS